VIQDGPVPTGIIDCRNHDNFLIKSCHASMIKYVARHVSMELPPTLTRAETEDPHHAILKQVLASLDIKKIPTPFRRMIVSLRVDRWVQLDDELFRAAFASELVGKQLFVHTLSTDERYLNQI
jgi:hypothetical protein